MSILSAQNISFRANKTTILKNVSAQFHAGEMVGLVGPNGAGKSSLLKAVLGLVKPYEGSFEIGGKSLATMPLKERAKQIAYSAQGAPVHWPLTVENIVALGRQPHMHPWSRLNEDDHMYIQDAMKKTDCLHLKERSTMTLSGGERARVMLARALATNAGFLLADEPTASLDPAHQLQIMNILKAESARGKGICIVLHDLFLARRYCDRIILLDKGRTVAQGAPQEVLSDANLARVFSIKVSHWKEGAEAL